MGETPQVIVYGTVIIGGNVIVGRPVPDRFRPADGGGDGIDTTTLFDTGPRPGPAPDLRAMAGQIKADVLRAAAERERR